MPHSNIATLFNFLLLSIAAFVIALAVAMRKKWISYREYLFVAPVLVVASGATVGSFLYKVMVPHTTAYIQQIAVTTSVFTLAIGMAMITIWKRTKRDEEDEKTRPMKSGKSQASKAQAGPPVSASELRKRKKKRI